MARALLVTIAAVLSVLALGLYRYAPPSPAPRDAPPDAFSARRARDVLEKIVAPDGASRMLGSVENAKARSTLVAELGKIGLDAKTQRALSCSHHGACGVVENVVARLEGADPSLPAVLLSAHYDSAPVSPGASDDGIGVAAVLETVRALAAGPKPKRSIVVLLSDGEENGLLGADAFVLSHPLAKTVKLALNVDARGSTGPSAMFETSSGNAWLVSRIVSGLPRPVTSSLFYEVYRRMPNDTDFTADKRIAHGLNFGNTSGIEHYHVPDDSLVTTDPGTLQHHGDHLLAAARALASFEGDPAEEARHGDAVWFDVLAAFVVSWPSPWALPLAILALVLVVVNAVRYRSWDAGVFVGPATLAAAIGAAAVVGWSLGKMGAIAAPWVAHPAPSLAALHASALAGGIAASASLARKATPRSLWVGTWLAWSALGVAAAIASPGTSYLFVAPSLVAGVLGAVPNPGVASGGPAVAASLVLFPITIALYDTIGLTMPIVVALPTALVTSTFAPFWSGMPRAGKRVPLVALAASVLCALVASVSAPFSTTSKQRVNVVFRQDDDRAQARVAVDTYWGATRWGDPPLAMKDALGAGGRPTRLEAIFPWSGPALAADVPKVALPPPELGVLETSLEDNRRHVRVFVRSRRGAPTLGIRLPSAAQGRSVDVSVCPHGKTTRENQGECAHATVRAGIVALHAVPKEGMDVELAAAGGPEPFAIELLDESYELPAGSLAAAVAAARPPEATPFQDGDVTIVAKSFAP